MELNREKVIRALEYCANNNMCVGKKCPYYDEGCDRRMPNDALSLIKELTEENERLGIENFDLICQLSRIKADTVRKMQERLKYTLCINNEENTEIFDYSYTLETIDQIAKEMMEGTQDA